MDIDEVNEVEMAVTPAPGEDASAPFQHLLPLFKPFPFTPEVCQGILARRSFMSNELIIDLLLEQAAVPSPLALYPPDSEQALDHLLIAINESPWDTLKRSALHYYLLCFMNTEIAQQATGLPPHFAALAQSCFLLDAGDPISLQQAVTLLSDGRIVQDLAPKVLQTLELAREFSLVRTYVRTAQPVLQSFEEAAIYLRALLDQSLADAWSFQRGFAEGSTVRNQLMRVILDACFMPPNPRHLTHLLSLPLSAFESTLLQAYALSPPSELSTAANAALQDLLTVRLLSSGKYSEAIRTSQALDEADKHIRVDKGPAADIQPLAREAAARRMTMRAVINVLPAVQRRDLERELGNLTDMVLKPNGITLPKSGPRDLDSLTSSWEDLAILSASRAGRLEGSPAPVRVTSAVKTPGGKAGMGVSIFGTPMSVGSPIRTQMPGKATPPVRPPGTTSTSTPTRPADMLIPKPIPPTPGVLPKSVPNVSTTLSATPPTHTRFGPTVAQSSAFLASSRPGRFGLQPTPTPPPSSLTPSPQKPPARTVGELFAGNSTPKEHTPTPRFGRPVTPSRQRTASPNGKRAEPPEDIDMVASDDPDAFVVHGRTRGGVSPQRTPQVSSRKASDEAVEVTEQREEADVENEVIMNSATQQQRVLPGGFTSFEIREDFLPEEPPKKKENIGQTRRTMRSSKSVEPASSTSPDQVSVRVKIPGGLYEDEEEEEKEQRDEVPSLVSPKRTTRQRGRGGRHSSASLEPEDEEDGPRLRRSSRISTQDHPSPQKKPAKEGKGGAKRKRK